MNRKFLPSHDEHAHNFRLKKEANIKKTKN